MRAVGFIVVVLVMCMACGSAPPPVERQTAPPVAPPAAPPAKSAQDLAQAQNAREFMANLVRNDFVKRSDLNTGKFYVDGGLWETFELDAKQKIVEAISQYRNFEFGLPQVTLLESKSGKELANYGPFKGVTIK